MVSAMTVALAASSGCCREEPVRSFFQARTHGILRAGDALLGAAGFVSTEHDLIHSTQENSMIHVVATVDLNPGTRDQFLTEFRKIVPDVKAEAGCIDYVPTIDAETGIPTQFKIGPDKITIIERWADAAALKAHLVAPHMQAYRPKVKAFVKGIEVRVFSPV